VTPKTNSPSSFYFSSPLLTAGGASTTTTTTPVLKGAVGQFKISLRQTCHDILTNAQPAIPGRWMDEWMDERMDGWVGGAD